MVVVVVVGHWETSRCVDVVVVMEVGAVIVAISGHCGNVVRWCISKIRGLLNLLNLLITELRRISRLSSYFSLKLKVDKQI